MKTLIATALIAAATLSFNAEAKDCRDVAVETAELFKTGAQSPYAKVYERACQQGVEFRNRGLRTEDVTVRIRPLADQPDVSYALWLGFGLESK